MGCDRNLFTLRLVLNQTQGEWQWQAAAVEWGGGQGGGGWSRESIGFCHVTRVWHYSPSLRWRVISKALGMDRRMERWRKEGLYEEK